MKKIIAFLLTVLLTASIFSSTVVAVEKDSIKSPSLSDGEITYDDSEDVKIEIIKYSERTVLNDDQKGDFEEAYYFLLKNSGDLTVLNNAVAQRARELYLDNDELAVSDIFDIRVTPLDHPACKVKLSTELMEDFVSFLYYENGKWAPVEGVTWSSDGKYIEFPVSGNHPYAVIVEAAKEIEEVLPIAQKDAPKIEYTTEESDITLIITPYKDRRYLSRVKERELEQCYRMIETVSSVINLNSDLSEVAKAKGFRESNIGVSQLFDISMSEERTAHFVVKLTTDAKDFVSLMRFVDDEWKIVEGVTVNYKTNSISFDMDHSSPFAIVSNGASATTPDTGDNNGMMIWAAVLAISSTCLIFAVTFKKNRKENE